MFYYIKIVSIINLGVLSTWKKSKNLRKTWKWMGGSNPNSIFFILANPNITFFKNDSYITNNTGSINSASDNLYTYIFMLLKNL